MAVSLSVVAAKDSAGTAIAGGLQAQDKSGVGTGPFTLGHIMIDGLAGTNMAAVTAANAVKVDGSAVTQPVSLSTVAVTNAGTFAVQVTSAPSTAVTNAGTFAVQVSNANANGSAVSASSAPVVIASDQATIPTSRVPTTSGGLSRTRTLIPANTTNVIVKASAGQVYKIRATNNSSTIAYIKLYDAATATAGAGTPVDTIMIPAATAGGAGIVDTTDIGVAHTTGITFIVTTGIADADTAAPAANAYVVTMFYK